MPQGCFIGNGNKMGEPIMVDSAADHIFGMVRGQVLGAGQGWERLVVGYKRWEGRRRGRAERERQGVGVGGKVPSK